MRADHLSGLVVPRPALSVYSEYPSLQRDGQIPRLRPRLCFIGSIRRECLDHVIVFGEQHLRRVLRSYQQYYNGTRTHLSLAKDAPLPRAIQTVGSILPLPVLGGLHHHYARI